METHRLIKGTKRKPVLRGGSWNNNDNNCRVANRNNNDPDNRNNNNGLRLVNAIVISQHEPEPAGGISAGLAIKVAQFCVPVRAHRMISFRLVGQKCFEYRNLGIRYHWLQPVVPLALAGFYAGIHKHARL